MLTCIQACRLSVTKTSKVREHSGSCSGRVLDSRQRGRRFEPHWHHCVVSLSKNIYPSLVLVQPRKTRPGFYGIFTVIILYKLTSCKHLIS